MRKMMSAIVSLSLIAVLLTGLTACGSNSGNGGNNEGNGNGGGGEKTNSSQTVPLVKTGESTQRLKIKSLGYDGAVNWDGHEDHEVYKAFVELCDRYYLDIEFELLYQDQYVSTLQTRIAAGTNIPDLFLAQMSEENIMNLGKRGIIVDIRKILDDHSNGNVDKYVEEHFSAMWGGITASTGEVFWIPQVQALSYKGGPVYGNHATLIRGDWLEQLGLPVPTTVDEFRDALKAFQDNDMNGNGKPDEVAIMHLTGGYYFATSFGLTPQHVSINAGSHKAESMWMMKDKMVDYLTFMNGLVNDGLMDGELADKAYEVQIRAIAGNAVSAYYGWAVEDGYDFLVEKYGGRYVPMMLGRNKGEVPCISSVEPGFMEQKYSVTKYANREAIGRLFDMLFTEEYADLCHYGLEGVTYYVDDEGTKVLNPGQLSSRDVYSKQATGERLWFNALPCFRVSTMESYLKGFRPERQADLAAYVDKYAVNPDYWHINGMGMAVPTYEESERLADIMGDINTFGGSGLQKMILGLDSIDNFDFYYDTMISVGLQDMIDIYQARHDRYLSIIN